MLVRPDVGTMRITRSYSSLYASHESFVLHGRAGAKMPARVHGANFLRLHAVASHVQQEVHVRTICFDPSFFLHLFCLPHTMCGFDTLVS